MEIKLSARITGANLIIPEWTSKKTFFFKVGLTYSQGVTSSLVESWKQASGKTKTKTFF